MFFGVIFPFSVLCSNPPQCLIREILCVRFFGV